MLTRHNHITRDIKKLGECPACDVYWKRDTPSLEQVLEAVHKENAGKINTHYFECWKRHAGCLAKLIQDITDNNQ